MLILPRLLVVKILLAVIAGKGKVGKTFITGMSTLLDFCQHLHADLSLLEFSNRSRGETGRLWHVYQRFVATFEFTYSDRSGQYLLIKIYNGLDFLI